MGCTDGLTWHDSMTKRVKRVVQTGPHGTTCLLIVSSVSCIRVTPYDQFTNHCRRVMSGYKPFSIGVVLGFGWTDALVKRVVSGLTKRLLMPCLNPSHTRSNPTRCRSNLPSYWNRHEIIVNIMVGLIKYILKINLKSCVSHIWR